MLNSLFSKPNIATIKKGYQRQPTILNGRLPWLDYDPDSQCFLLEDGYSVGALFELSNVACEAKPQSLLIGLRDKLQRLLQDTVPQELDSPWVLQFYLQDELSLSGYERTLREYIKQQGNHVNHYINLFTNHFKLITQSNGLFIDREVSGTLFQGKQRRIRLALYRKLTPLPRNKKHKKNPIQQLNAVAKTLVNQLESTGIEVFRCDGKAFFEWMVRWFNPAPTSYNGDVDQLIRQSPYPGDNQRPFGYDFAEQLFYSPPRSDLLQGIWYFDDKPHKFLTVDALRTLPDIGQISGERNNSGKIAALFDYFPTGSIWTMAITIEHQEKIRNHIVRINDSCVGDNIESQLTRKDCQQAQENIAQGNYLFPTVMGVYLRGKDIDDLLDKEIEAEMLLNNNGLRTIRSEQELMPLDAYLRYLPFCYDYQFDKKNTRRSRLIFAKQLAHLLPVYGRYRGTNHPGISFWNRAGEPLTFDPFHRADKSFNSHLLFLGATGAGKSASLVSILMQIMAIYKPRLFIIEAGNSFGLLCDYWKKHGLTTEQVTLKANKPIPLNPFRHARKILPKITKHYAANAEIHISEMLEQLKNSADNEDLQGEEERDYLGEMALMCQLMITGGEAKEEERITRQDRQIIIEAIIDAALHTAKRKEKEMIASDVVEAFHRLAKRFQKNDETIKATKTRDMADSLSLFCTDPLLASFFNCKGNSWPTVDITRLDMGIMKDEGYEAPLALAFMGIMTTILAIAEATQYDDRMCLVLIDESHIITKNPLAAAVVTKISKMSRKLGLWLWFATQNISDFPDESRKMLTMLEFWLCLGTSEDELSQIERFKTITPEERELFKSVRKSIPNYVEGVILSPKVKGLFRNIPPRLALALGMTEKEEKAKRKKLMEEHNISEVEAAEYIALDMIKNLMEEQ